MIWNYRVIKHKQKDGADYLAIHEVYYDEPDGAPHSCTEDAIKMIGDDIKGLRWTLRKMLKATEMEILHDDDFKGETE